MYSGVSMNNELTLVRVNSPDANIETQQGIMVFSIENHTQEIIEMPYNHNGKILTYDENKKWISIEDDSISIDKDILLPPDNPRGPAYPLVVNPKIGVLKNKITLRIVVFGIINNSNTNVDHKVGAFIDEEFTNN
jgi:hypothetical protein